MNDNWFNAASDFHFIRYAARCTRSVSRRGLFRKSREITFIYRACITGERRLRHGVWRTLYWRFAVIPYRARVKYISRTTSEWVTSTRLSQACAKFCHACWLIACRRFYLFGCWCLPLNARAYLENASGRLARDILVSPRWCCCAH